MKAVRKFIGLYAFCALIPSVGAGDVPPEPVASTVEMSLPHLVDLALSNNPTIQQTLADVSRARGERWHNTRKLNPSFGYVASEVGNEGRAGQQGLYLSQEFITANKLGLNDQIGGWDVQMLNWRWQVQELQVSGEVRQRYYEVLACRRRVDVLTQLDKILTDGVTSTQRLIDVGEIGKGQLLQAQLEQQQNELSLNNEQKKLRAAEQALGVVVGLPDLSVSFITGSLGSELPVMEPHTSWNGVIQSHPMLESAKAEVAKYQWAIQRECVEPLPNVQSQFTLQYDDATKYTVGGIQLALELPVHNQNAGKISAANAQYIRASHEVQRIELELKSQFVEAYRNYEIAQATTDRILNKLLPLAQENLQTTKELYQLGETSYVNLLTAQRAYVEILMSLVNARRDAWQAVALIESQLLSDALSSTER